MSQSVPVKVFTPGGQRTLDASTENPQLITTLLAANGMGLNTRCGQRGLCDGCIIELLQGELQHHVTSERLTANGSPVELRACEYKLADLATSSPTDKPVALRVPPRALLSHRPQVVSFFKINVSYAHDPIWSRLTIPATHLPHGWIRSENPEVILIRTVQNRTNSDANLLVDRGMLSDLINDNPSAQAWDVTIQTLPTGRTITHVLPVNSDIPRAADLGAAIDIGTTTVAVLLVDLATGKVVAKESGFNHQMHLGDNVLTRINLCLTDPKALGQLQKAVIDDTLVPLLQEALTQAGAKPEQVQVACIGANTTMLHLFAGVDPGSMGTAPFTPSFVDHVLTPAMPKVMTKSSKVHLLPSCAAYIGADLTAGLLATGLIYEEGPSLLVDVGTNGEIILKHGDKLLGCATAAGPAFEGAGLSSGLRAVNGAVSHFRTNGEGETATLQFQYIGSKPENHWHESHAPDEEAQTLGICGSAYIDLLAELRRALILNESGRFNFGEGQPDHPMFDHTPSGFRGLIVAKNHKRKPVLLTEPDIASLMQAKAAIAAGILTLLHRVGLTPADIKTVYLAGGFGLHLNVRNTIDSGLLPGFKFEQVKVVGNTSLAGAYVAMLDSGALAEMRRAARVLEAVELNLDPEFEGLYIDQLSLP